jgi:ABC-type Fe3+ transport system permease subunit
MDVLILLGIACVAALGMYLLVAGLQTDPGGPGSEPRRRGSWLGALYLVAGALPAALGLLLVLDTAPGSARASKPVDTSFAGGLWSGLDDEVWYAAGGWLLLGGVVVTVGAWCGRRGWPFARGVLTFGLLLLGIPGLLAGVGILYLAIVPTLLFWRHELERPEAS